MTFATVKKTFECSLAEQNFYRSQRDSFPPDFIHVPGLGDPSSKCNVALPIFFRFGSQLQYNKFLRFADAFTSYLDAQQKQNNKELPPDKKIIKQEVLNYRNVLLPKPLPRLAKVDPSSPLSLVRGTLENVKRAIHHPLVALGPMEGYYDGKKESLAADPYTLSFFPTTNGLRMELILDPASPELQWFFADNEFSEDWERGKWIFEIKDGLGTPVVFYHKISDSNRTFLLSERGKYSAVPEDHPLYPESNLVIGEEDDQAKEGFKNITVIEASTVYERLANILEQIATRTKKQELQFACYYVLNRLLFLKDCSAVLNKGKTCLKEGKDRPTFFKEIDSILTRPSSFQGNLSREKKKKLVDEISNSLPLKEVDEYVKKRLQSDRIAQYIYNQHRLKSVHSSLSLVSHYSPTSVDYDKIELEIPDLHYKIPVLISKRAPYSSNYYRMIFPLFFEILKMHLRPEEIDHLLKSGGGKPDFSIFVRDPVLHGTGKKVKWYEEGRTLIFPPVWLTDQEIVKFAEEFLKNSQVSKPENQLRETLSHHPLLAWTLDEFILSTGVDAQWRPLAQTPLGDNKVIDSYEVKNKIGNFKKFYVIFEKKGDQLNPVTVIPYPIELHGKGKHTRLSYTMDGFFRVSFGSAPETIASNNVLLEFLKRKRTDENSVPDSFSRKVHRILFHKNHPRQAGTYSIGTVDIFESHQATMRTFVHELSHHWDFVQTSPQGGIDLKDLFSKISWRGPREEEQIRECDFNDFFGNYYSLKDYPYNLLPSSCRNKETYPYGMRNPAEDLATTFERFYDGGMEFATHARQQMGEGNFEPAVKYLFARYLAFEGREYGASLAYEEVRQELHTAIQKGLKVAPSTLEVFNLIPQISPVPIDYLFAPWETYHPSPL